MSDQPSPTVRRRVVLTGAAGNVGRAVSTRLAGRWDLVLTDRRSAVEGLDGVVVAHAVSANRHNVAELDQTRRAIGYVPVDDAWGDA